MGRGVHLGGTESRVCPGVCLAPSGAFPHPSRTRASRVATADDRRRRMKGEKRCIRRHENGVGTRKRAMHRNDLQGQGQGRRGLNPKGQRVSPRAKRGGHSPYFMDA